MVAEARFTLKKTTEFDGWHRALNDSDRTRIDARLDHMRFGIFAHSKSLAGGLFETKWRSGMRVYYSRTKIADADVIAVWGGFKGTQKADIRKARAIKRRYEDAYEK